MSREPQPPSEGTYVIRSGIRVDVGIRVRTYQETGYAFPSRTRRSLTRMVIAHATAAENPPKEVHRNMLQHLSEQGRPQPLSVHFVIDQKGTIFQMMDTDARGAHCAGAYESFSPNAVSIGIEVIGRLTDWRKVPDKGVVRPRVIERIHGVDLVVDEMLRPQCEATANLCEALCRIYALPLRVPEDAQGEPLLAQLSEADAAKWSGCCGHLHMSGAKPDPGGLVLRAIQERGRPRRA